MDNSSSGTCSNQNGDKAKASLSENVLKTLKEQASSDSVMQNGPIYLESLSSEEAMEILLEQLDSSGIIYQTNKTPDNKNVISIIGVVGDDGNPRILAKEPQNVREKKRATNKPTGGEWNKDDEDENIKGERGDGRYMPNPEPTKKDENGDLKYPSGHPHKVPSDPDKADTYRENNKNRPTPVDQIFPIYNKDGEPLRYPWGSPGDYDPGEPPVIKNVSLIAQIEAFVNGHLIREAKRKLEASGQPVPDPFILKPPFVFNGVLFSNGYPVMDEFSMGTVDMEVFSSNREVNFKNGDELMAAKLNADYEKLHNKKRDPLLTSADVKKYREDNDLTWHEDPSCSKMMKVPTLLHANVSHTGGVSEMNFKGDKIYYGTDSPNAGIETHNNVKASMDDAGQGSR